MIYFPAVNSKKKLIWIKFRCRTIIFTFLALLTIHGSLFTTVYAQTATLSLSPSSGTFNRGCSQTVNITLNTGGAQTDGTDAILIYDPSRLNAISIVNGTIYADYPGNNIDSANGKITVSGLASVTAPFTGQGGVLATINFIVKSDAPVGVTQVNFDFDANNKSKTTDSNVVQRGTVADILNSVVNGSYTVGTGACSGGSTILPATGGVGTPSGAVSSPSSSPSQALPPAGFETLTYTLAIVGSILTVLGILGLAIL